MRMILKNKIMRLWAEKIYCFLGRNRKLLKGINNKVSINNGFVKKCRIVITGNNNQCIISKHCKIDGLYIYIHGNNNYVYIGENCILEKGSLFVEDDGNCIKIESGNTLCNGYHLACIEGTKIIIGKNCLFSSDISIRTGDSHSILDRKTNCRLNYSKDVILGEHIWCGNKSIILKGTQIANDSVIGTGSIVTKKFSESNIILAGVPARCIHTGIHWEGERLA